MGDFKTGNDLLSEIAVQKQMIDDTDSEKEKRELRQEGKLLVSKLGKTLRKKISKLVKVDSELKRVSDLMMIIKRSELTMQTAQVGLMQEGQVPETLFGDTQVSAALLDMANTTIDQLNVKCLLSSMDIASFAEEWRNLVNLQKAAVGEPDDSLLKKLEGVESIVKEHIKNVRRYLGQIDARISDELLMVMRGRYIEETDEIIKNMRDEYCEACNIEFPLTRMTCVEIANDEIRDSEIITKNNIIQQKEQLVDLFGQQWEIWKAEEARKQAERAAEEKRRQEREKARERREQRRERKEMKAAERDTRRRQGESPEAIEQRARKEIETILRPDFCRYLNEETEESMADAYGLLDSLGEQLPFQGGGSTL